MSHHVLQCSCYPFAFIFDAFEGFRANIISALIDIATRNVDGALWSGTREAYVVSAAAAAAAFYDRVKVVEVCATVFLSQHQYFPSSGQFEVRFVGMTIPMKTISLYFTSVPDVQNMRRALQ